MTNFVYVCESIKDSNVMCNDNKKALRASDILYVNRLTNVVYQDGEILETTYRKAKKDTLTEAIFDVFARMLTRSGDERKVLYHLIFDKAEYTKNSLSKHLSAIYFKSERTYQRAIDDLLNRRFIQQSKSRILKVPIDYDLSLLDLENVKSIIIHIN